MQRANTNLESSLATSSNTTGVKKKAGQNQDQI